MANKTMRRYSLDQLIEAVSKSNSINQVVLRLNISDSGGNYSTIRRDIINAAIDTSHFGTIEVKKKSIEQVSDLILYSNKKSSEIKRFLLCQGILQNRCSECGLGDSWNGRPITLQLDHINGESRDNRLENLRILCPNCHSQTPTFCRSKNKKIVKIKAPKKKVEAYKKIRKFEVSKEDLIGMMAHMNWSQIGRHFGVTGNAIKKRAKLLGIL